MAEEYLTDKEALEFLRLLARYVRSYPGGDISLSELAADLAMSMDETTDEADQLRADIEGMLGA